MSTSERVSVKEVVFRLTEDHKAILTPLSQHIARLETQMAEAQQQFKMMVAMAFPAIMHDPTLLFDNEEAALFRFVGRDKEPENAVSDLPASGEHPGSE